MFLPKKHIPRRTFLRGAGVTLALPLLDAIVGVTGRGRDEARAMLVAANPGGRLVTPGEVATAVRDLCRREAAAVTGQAIQVPEPDA